jgi:hypothetical protein
MSTPTVLRPVRPATPADLWRLADLAEGHNEEFLATLGFYARFHRYSFNNCLLIGAQCPEATRVAGLKTWNSLGYRIRAGERAIWIWCPIVAQEIDALTGEEVEVVVGFRPGPVFDASQLANLDEKPLPPLVRPLPDDAEATYQLAVGRITASGIAVVERPLPDGIFGASTGGRIVVREGLDSRTRLVTLLHEFAHELAHQGEERRAKPLAARELEAEATAFVVAAVLELESIGSRDYLLLYQIGPTELKASLVTIQGLVRRVLAVVEPAMTAPVRLAA